jgi:hypothetical protein
MKIRNTLLNLGAMAVLGSSAFGATHVTADITVNTQWTKAAGPYILENVIFVRGCTLDIEPGTVIRGQPRSDAVTFNPGALVVRPDAKIQARGTLADPIIFTTAAQSNGAGGFTDVDANLIPDRWIPANGDGNYYDAAPATAPLPPKNAISGAKNANMWGGIVLMGTAPTNNGNQVDVAPPAGIGLEDDGFGVVEGLSGADAIYGGGNSDHNGGFMKYVSIRHGGAELVANRELNGLTLCSVGRKTAISYIDVYSTGDDGVEIFGGTVNIDHININYADDDGFDTDEGWSGIAQYIFIMQGLGFGDSGMELDGEDKGEGHPSAPIDPVGDAKIYNATVLMDTGDNAAGTRGLRLRAGFAGTVANSIVKNWAATPAGTGFAVDGLSLTGVAPETAPSARDQFDAGLLQLRNNTAHNFSTGYTSFAGVNLTQAVTGAVTGTFAGSAVPNVFYQATNNRNTLDPYTGLLKTAVFNHTLASGVDPRPALAASSGAYNTPQDTAYVPSPVDVTTYRGAFDRSAATLWTSGWTALNLRGILKN